MNTILNMWHLMRCSMGHTFGFSARVEANCTICGNSNVKKIREFETAEELALAVSQSNLPPELASKVKLKLEESSKSNNSQVSKFQINDCFNKSTNELGHINIEKLKIELKKLGNYAPSAEQLIGQAELEGEMIRIDDENWEWI